MKKLKFRIYEYAFEPYEKESTERLWELEDQRCFRNPLKDADAGFLIASNKSGVEIVTEHCNVSNAGQITFLFSKEETEDLIEILKDAIKKHQEELAG